uniref:Uncharacterized protein n=1 Tax=viral metagenome TaxID=1070528 RepID=A0A6C0KME8_9ZZZZ
MFVDPLGKIWKLYGEIGFDNSDHEALNKFSALLEKIYDETEGNGVKKGWVVNGATQVKIPGSGLSFGTGDEIHCEPFADEVDNLEPTAGEEDQVPFHPGNLNNFEIVTDVNGPIATIHYEPGNTVEIRLGLLKNGFFVGEVAAPWVQQQGDRQQGDRQQGVAWNGEIDLEFRNQQNKLRKFKYNIFLSEKHSPVPGSLSLMLVPDVIKGVEFSFISERKLIGALPITSFVKYSKVKTAVQNVFSLIDPKNAVWPGKIQDDVAENLSLGLAAADFAFQNFKAALEAGAFNTKISMK